MTPALIILLVAGLALRFAIAFLFFPQGGFSSDLSSYAAWANTLAQYGPSGFYANAGFADYPPGYLLLLWPIGLIAQSGGLGLATEDLIKIPPILIDIAVGLVLYLLVKAWARPRGRRWAERAALAACAMYVFNPVTWYDSALWGQTDAAGALVILLGVAALIRGNSEGAATLAVIAAMVKPQFGVVLIPLVGVVLLKRHLFDAGSGPVHRPLIGGRLGRWLVENQGPVRIGTAFLVAWFVFFVMAIPFGMGPYEYLTFISKTAGGYPYLTVNGYNFWALIGSEGGGSLASDGIWSRDTVPLLGPIPGVVIGAALLIVGFLVGLWAAFRRDNRASILVAAVVLSAAFFVLPTRVHERYLFPVFALLPILAVWSRRWRWATLAFAVGSFINLHAILTNANPQYGTDNVANLPFGDLFRTFPFVGLAVVLQTGAFLFAVWQLRARNSDLAQLVETPAQRHDGRAATPGLAPPVPAGQTPQPGAQPAEWGAPAYAAALPEPEGDSLYAAETQAGAEAAEISAAEDAATLVGEDEDAGRSDWPGWGTWIDGKLGTLRPIRRDRSAELTLEPSGRFDRFDALILVVLTVGSLALRAWHLDQPRDMYFDEVYHARTATEFLQDWKYGIVHSIYEYTHPHIAKYAMALGLEALGDNKVVSTASLGGPVSDAALETRWSPPSRPGERNGDRLYVVDGTDLRVYDLASRQLITTIQLEKPATAVAVNDDGHQLYIASNDGTISQLDTTDLDDLRADPSATVNPPTPILTLSGTTGDIVQLVVVDDQLVARTSDGWLAAIDPANAAQTGTLQVPGAVKAVAVPATDQVVVDQTKVTNLEQETTSLATALALDASVIRPLLTGTSSRAAVTGYLSDTDRSAVQKEIDAGKLPGVTIESGPVVAVSDPQGVSFLDAQSLSSLNRLTIEGARGMALADRGGDDTVLYVAVDGKDGPQLVPISMNDTGPSSAQALKMPGVVDDVVWNEPAKLVHVVGQTANGDPTIYVLQVADPRQPAVYADAQLPSTPLITLADTQRDRPESDRTDLLAIAPDGTLSVIDAGQNAFAWRFPGVIMGTLTLVCIYLLSRFLFRRRSVALFGAALGLVGGMFFSNARIGMNDTYVAGFIMAALTVFVPLYLGLWRRRWQVILGLLAVGILLGLALASKWVGAYAIGGIALLFVLRSALGRIMALVGMIGLTAVLGALAVRAPDVAQPHVNVFFLGLMLVLTVALAVAMVRRPIRMTMAELRFAVFAPAVAGIVLIAGSLAFASQLPDAGFFTARYVSLAGAAALLVSAGSYAIAWLAGRRGRGPLARRRIVPPDEPVPSPAPTGWLLPGHAGGIPWLYAVVCFSVVPILVYIASYIPWYNLGNQLIAGVPAGHTGQTLWQLTLSMYDYHNNLRAGHPASSPWWAWLLDLKPVWFYQEGFANNTTGVIYDAENLVIVWLGIPAMIFATWAAWKRRSLGLTVIVLMFAAMWIPWSRIDRATFQYHVFTSLPFVAMALAYFLAELWHGPSPGVWLFARFSAALAILGAPLLWLARAPLCIIAGSAAAHTAENSGQGIACGSITRSTDVSQAAMVSVVILLIGALVLGWQLWLFYRAGGRTEPIRVGGLRIPVEMAPYLTLVAIIAIVVIVPRVFSGEPLFTLTVSADELALIGVVVLAIPAYLVLRARDSRRFALGIMTAAVLWFVAWYPNLSGLPMPNSIANIYQGLLPTWNYDFWFAVNKDPAAKGPLGALVVGILIITLIAVAVAMIATYWLRPERQVAAAEDEVSAPVG